MPVRDHCNSVVYFISKDANEKNTVVKAVLKMHKRRWQWTLNKKSFEHVHGMSRVVRLLPDKFATTLVINRESDNDGSNLIKLVIDLLQIYIDLIPKPEAENCSGELSEHLYVVGEGHEDFEAEHDFESLLQAVKKVLVEIETDLESRNENGVLAKMEELIKLSDDILVGCKIYLDFIHPVLIGIDRSGEINEESIETQKASLERKLVAADQCLEKQFAQLLRESNQ